MPAEHIVLHFVRFGIEQSIELSRRLNLLHYYAQPMLWSIVTIPFTTDAVRGSESMHSIKEWSTLMAATGSFSRSLNDEYPLPKSSMDTQIPSSRSLRSFDADNSP